MLDAALKLFSAGAKALEPLTNHLFRGRRAADAELAKFRDELSHLLGKITSSSTEAQMAVRGSSNEPKAQDAHLAAIRISTEVGQEFANLFDVEAIAHNIPAGLVQARRRYREAVTDERNIELLDSVERELQCAEIESAAASFHREISAYALKNWGTGLGAKAGRQRGRRFPT